MSLDSERFRLPDIVYSSASLKIKAVKLIDYIFGPLLSILFSVINPPSKQKTDFPKSLLVIRPGGIGDAVWVKVILNQICLRYPLMRVDVLCEKRNSQVFYIGIDQGIGVYYPGNRQKIRHMLRNYDVVIDTEQFHFLSAIIASFFGSYRIGFSTRKKRSPLYSLSVLYRQDSMERHMFLSLFKAAEFDVDDQVVPYQCGEAERRWVKDLQINGTQKIGVFCGASIKERFWGEEYFYDLCRDLIQHKMTVILIGGKEDISVSSRLALKLPGLIDLAGKMTLNKTAALFETLDLIVGADSGIMHLAASLNKKCIWLFGPGIEQKWKPDLPGQHSINLHVRCSPCTIYGYTPVCPNHMMCMVNIKPALVLEKINHVLG